jgi:hypothetical protein
MDLVHSLLFLAMKDSPINAKVGLFQKLFKKVKLQDLLKRNAFHIMEQAPKKDAKILSNVNTLRSLIIAL